MLSINKKENFSKEKTGGRVDPSSPAGSNRLPSQKFIHAKLGEMGDDIFERDFEEIENGCEYPNIKLLASFSRSGDPRDFEDWVHFLMRRYDISRPKAYNMAEDIAVRYFKIERFTSYGSFKSTINNINQNKTGKIDKLLVTF